MCPVAVAVVCVAASLARWWLPWCGVVCDVVFADACDAPVCCAGAGPRGAWVAASPAVRSVARFAAEEVVMERFVRRITEIRIGATGVEAVEVRKFKPQRKRSRAERALRRGLEARKVYAIRMLEEVDKADGTRGVKRLGKLVRGRRKARRAAHRVAWDR